MNKDINKYVAIMILYYHTRNPHRLNIAGERSCTVVLNIKGYSANNRIRAYHSYYRECFKVVLFE